MRAVRRLLAIGSAATLLAAPPAWAQSLSWDTTAGTTGAQGGTGTWNHLGNTNWWNGSTNVQWNNALNSATFAGTAGTVTLSGALQASGLTLSTAGYTLTSGSLQLTGTTLSVGANATINSALTTSTVSKTGAGVLTLGGNATFGALTVNTAGAIVLGTGSAWLGSATVNQAGSVNSADRYTNNLLNKGLHFGNGQSFSVSNTFGLTDLNADPVVGVRNGTTVTYTGNWVGDGGNSEQLLALVTNGKLVFGASATVDLINTGWFTRQFWVHGDGTGTWEFAEGFVADRSAGGTVQDGLGSVRLGNVTWVTNHSQNIPVHYRPASLSADGQARENGHIVFERQGGRWRVQTNDQSTVSAVWPTANCVIDTQTNLIHTGVTRVFTDSYTAYNAWQIQGTSGSSGSAVTMTKVGPGALNLSGEQAYYTGSTLNVDEGTVNFNTDPMSGTAIFTNGQNLGINVKGWTGSPATGIPNPTGASATVNFNAPLARIRALSLATGATVSIAAGKTLDVSTGLTIAGGALTADGTLKSPTTTVSGGQLTINGTPDATTAITVSGTGQVSFGGSSTAFKTFTVGASGSHTVATGFTMDLNTSLAMAGGSLAVNGTVQAPAFSTTASTSSTVTVNSGGTLSGSTTLALGSGSSLALTAAAGSSVTLPAAATFAANSLLNLSGAVALPNTMTMTLGTGSSYNPRNYGLRFTDSRTVPSTVSITNSGTNHANLAVSGAGTVVTYNGSWSMADGSFSSISLLNGGKFVLGPQARINNNQTDSINARPWRAYGDGTHGVIEFDAGFDADISKSYTLADGLSTFRLDTNITWITHATQSLPSIYKLAGGGGNTHHGAISFDAAFGTSGPRWWTRTNAQSYDGQVGFSKDFILETEADFTFNGWIHAGANVAWWGNPAVSTTATLIKRGAGTFTLAGDQGYRAGSIFAVQEGTVRFDTDPTQTLSFDSSTGQYLTVNVSGDAAVVFTLTAGSPTSLVYPQTEFGPAPTTARLFDLNLSGNARVTVPAGKTLNVTDPGAGVSNIDLLGGVIDGGGTIVVEGVLVNTGGTVSPGQSPGLLAIVGDYQQDLGGTLRIEVQGTTPGSGYDVLSVTGTATLGGTLELDFTGYGTPQTGIWYTFLTAGGISGTFDSFTTVGLNPLLSINADFDQGRFSVVPEPGTLALLGLGSLVLRRRRPRR